MLVLLVLCATAAGCASSRSGTTGSDDPAALVPASAPLYAEATLPASGKVRNHAEAALRKVLHTNDVDTWLGDEAGAAVTSLRAKHDADYVVVIASKDDAKAADALGHAPGANVTRSYKGVDYRFNRQAGTAAAVLADHVVLGTENGVRSSIDASKGDSLASTDGLRAVRAKVASDRVGLFYADTRALVQAIAQGASNPQIGLLLQAASAAAPKAVGGALQALPGQLRVDAVSIGTPTPATAGRSGAGALAALPADSWLGLGVADLGQTLDGVVDTVAKTSGLSAIGVNAALGQFRQQTGLDLRRDVLSWMGDAGLYVAGTTPHDLRGALVVKTSDPAATKRAVAALAELAGRSASATGDTDAHGRLHHPASRRARHSRGRGRGQARRRLRPQARDRRGVRARAHACLRAGVHGGGAPSSAADCSRRSSSTSRRWSGSSRASPAAMRASRRPSRIWTRSAPWWRAANLRAAA